VREVIDMVKEQSGQEFSVTETGRRAGDPAALMADNTRIREVLGWQPEFDDLATIVSTALAWEKIWLEKQNG
jgi:UDP-glucose 4-epimerase